MEETEITTLKVQRSTRDYLDSKGKRGETFDDIIRRLLKIKCKKE